MRVLAAIVMLLKRLDLWAEISMFDYILRVDF